MQCDIIIINGKLVRPDGIFEGDVLISDGKIAGVTHSAKGIKSRETIDAKGLYVLPGAIDPHVHLGSYNSQDFAGDLRSETAASVVGGVTTLFCFLKADGSFRNVIKSCIEDVEKNSLIDIGFHLILFSGNHIEEIPVYMKEGGVTSFKFFRAPSGDTMSSAQGVDDGLLYRAFQKISREEGSLAIIHAEDLEIIREISQGIKAEGRQDAAAGSRSRPSFCEEMSICSGIILAHHTKTPLSLAHVSAGDSLDFIAQSKAKGLPLFVETCPHYLFFTKETPFRTGPIGKVNPPLRGAADQEALWKAISNGLVDTIGSDHCPYTLASKGNDLWTARPGLPGIGLLLPVLLSEGVNRGRIRMEDVARVCSRRPAEIFGLWPQKGMIQAGFDADLVLVDLDKKMKVTPENLHSRSDYSPYEGYSLKGWPVMTMVAGRVLYRDGQLFASEPQGKYLWRKGEKGVSRP